MLQQAGDIAVEYFEEEAIDSLGRRTHPTPGGKYGVVV
jgi:hypothetical protein